MQADPAPRVVATEAALAVVGRLRAEHGPLLFFQSGGCCDGSSPMRFREAGLRFVALSPESGWTGYRPLGEIVVGP
jgi:uncharacterized protein (DUF779 family)